MAASDDLVLEHLDRWAEDLVDLSRRNRLLYFKHTKSASLEFAQDAFDVERGLSRRTGWGFHMPVNPPDHPTITHESARPAEDELVVSLVPTRYRPELERGLKNLSRRAEAEFLDAGIWVLYLGLGRLDWVDVDDKAVQSPLLLVPVRLVQEGVEKRWRLRLSDDGEAALNPALAVKLERDFGISLPSLDEVEEADLDHVVAAVGKAVGASPWRIEPVATLSTITFHKEVIYRDLRRNASVIASHPTIRLLAEGPASELAAELDFTPEPPEALDRNHPPEDLACILDADATQRQCVIAARAGHSFVMSGPPGTGKSQTIANVIAQLLKDGRTVLFVSEKAAALDVVQRRLAGRHLDEFVLSLHSQNATRKAVAQELARTLDERPTARSHFDASKRDRLMRDRTRLTDYAVAVNEVRQPLDLSLHEVAGRIAKLDQLPEVALPDVPSTRLSATELSHLVEAADRLGRAWGPVSRGESFLWKNLVDQESGPGRTGELRRRVESCLAAVRTLQSTSASICDQLRLPQAPGPGPAGAIMDLLDLVDDRHPVDDAWLTIEDADEVDFDVHRIVTMMRCLHAGEEALSGLSAGWRALDPSCHKRFGDWKSRLGEQVLLLGLLDPMDADALEALGESLEEAADAVHRVRQGILELAAIFEVRRLPTVGVGRRLAELGGLAGSTDRPEAGWLDARAKPAVDEAARVLSELVREYRLLRDELREVFDEPVLELDLRSLQTRFREVHTGVHKLSTSYRSDKRTLAGVTVTGKVTEDVISALDRAIAWQAVAERLDQAERRHAAILGPRYYPSRNEADLDALERAVAVADCVLSLAAGDVAPSVLAAQLSATAQPEPRLIPAVGDVGPASALLVERLLRFGPDALATVDLLQPDDARAWCTNVAQIAREMAGELRDVGSVIGGSLSVADAKALASRRADVADLADEIEAEKAARAGELGELVASTSAHELEGAIAWVASVRRHFGGRVRRRTGSVILRTDLSADTLRDPWLSYDKQASALFGEFNPGYGDDLRLDCDTSFAGAVELLDALLATSRDIDEWSAHVHARTELIEAGCSTTVRDCQSLAVPAGQVRKVIERAIFTRWVVEVMRADARLEPGRSIDRDELLAAFRSLDRELVDDAAAAVINACTERRPRSLAGGAGLIKKEGRKQRRHKPVRRLLEEAGDAAQQLKPCFMMSPLSVSQFIPPGMTFDVVIFDEASQVREADAVCSIYRGYQLIVAGDSKQLPPTDFFSRVVDGDVLDGGDESNEIDEFESVLERCSAQGVKELPLLWHYRSRHEALISFSNREFYDGRLHTFPGAIFDAGDLGVELFLVDGQYQRGTTRDNPIEADKVVDRIVEHRRRHPKLTIGVVALSAAQQACIEMAIERRQEQDPELRGLVTDDRLDGFFVKNLENVQGDERDVIILSIGYGRDEHGKLTQTFGPMNREGGWRRLNVAVTRARRRVEVVSSITAGDIRGDKRSSRALSRYLDYAERGLAALAIDPDEGSHEAESPFEEAVLAAVRAMGHDAVSQVGVAGYRIDIGIRHPTEPGRYLLGIECDGFTYHSSKVARDRDRLRQDVLEGLGWTLHRIWSTAWFSDRSGEETRLRSAIETALSAGRGPGDAPAPPPQPVEIEVDEFDFDDYPDWAYVYEPPTTPTMPFHGLEFVDPSARAAIVRQIVEVVSASGPIHEYVVLDVLREAWGHERAGTRIRNAYLTACDSAVARGDIEVDGEFFRVPGGNVVVRVPASGTPPVRKVGHVSPCELDLALRQLLGDAGSCDPVSLRTEWARLFGWQRVGSDIEIAFDDAVDRLMAKGSIDGPDPLRLVV